MLNRSFLDKVRISGSGNIRERDYWLSRLSGELEITFFPYDYLNTHEGTPSHPCDSVEFNLNGELFSQLMRLSNNYDYTLYMVLLAGLVVLLDRYSFNGSGDIILGAPIYKQETKGEFINTVLALKNSLNPYMTFKELLLQVKQTVTEANENQNYPIELLVEQLNLPLCRDDFPLFEVAILLENIHEKEYLKHLHLNMLLSFNRANDCIRGKVEYNASLYRASTVERIIAQYKRVLKMVLLNLNKRVVEIEILSLEEKKEILFDFNLRESEYPIEETIDRLFVAQAEKTPDHIALVGRTQGTKFSPDILQITYLELNQSSDRLAFLLTSGGVLSNRIVAIMMERSYEMILGILSILKTGAAYLPINPQNPGERINYMLADSGAEVLLVASETKAKVKAEVEEKLPGIIDISNLLSSSTLATTSRLATAADNLAYIIYTSGSTGNPKGVPITHANLSPLLHWGYRHLGINGQYRVIQNLSYYFDWSVWEIFITLTSGAGLYMIGNDVLLNPDAQVDFIRKYAISILHATPTQYQYLVDVGQRLETLEYLFLGAEKLNENLLRRSIESVSVGCRIFNMYGPTEATIISAVLEVDRNSLDEYASLFSVPIGRAVGNTMLLVLANDLGLCPLQAPGELYIAGDGIAKGYINDPEKTRQAFISNIYAEIPGKCLYKTGDRVRWLRDGTMEFLGRIDYQVKIRGYRIEPGEIENKLLEHKMVKEALIVSKENQDGEKYLCAYVVPLSTSTGRSFSLPRLREYLSLELPDYMIPACFITLEKIPINPNGKVDTKALPEPGSNFLEGIYTAPRDEIETRLTGIWSEVLGIDADKIGIDTHFFALGGHSLKATSIISKIHRVFNVQLNIVEVFRIPTIREMAAAIKQAVEDRHHSIEPVEKKAYYPLSPAQTRLYILQQVEPNAVGYNMPMALMLEGRVHRDKIEEAFKKLIQRHEVLRTSFEMIGDEPVQRIHEDVEFEMEYFDMGIRQQRIGNKEKRMPESIIKAFIHPFDLSRAPLLRAGLIIVDEVTHILMVDMHHIAVDGTSFGLIVNQFASFYLGNESLPLKIQYKDFSEWKTGKMQVEDVKQQKQYWLSQFENQLPVLNLPVDNLRPAIQNFAGNRINFEVEQKEIKALTQLALREGATLYMVLLAIINVILSKLSGQEDIIIGSPVAGRRHVDLEPIIGMFANTLALRNYPVKEKTFITFLGEVKASTLNAYANQDYPFEELVNSVNLHRDASRNPVFDVLFVLQNMEQSLAQEIPGVKVSPFPIENFTAKFDLQFNGVEREGKLRFTLEYSTALFRESTIMRIIERFKQLITEIIAYPGKKLDELEIVGPGEKQEILEFSRGPWDPIDRRETIHHWFEQRVNDCRDKLALVFGDQELTYGELNRRAGQLAAHLGRKGVSPGTVVGLMAERSIEMVIGILAILKAGGAYLPVDIDYPETRTKYLLEDSGIKLVLTAVPQETTHGGIHFGDDTGMSIERIDIRDKSLYCSFAEVGETNANGSSLLYVIYTSGSTGNPKGVMMEHRALVNLLKYQMKYTGIPFRRVLQFITISFDVSFQEIFSTLTAGGILYLINKDSRADIRELFKVIEKNVIETLFLPASFLKFVLNEEEYAGVMPGTVKHIITAGEQLLVANSFRKYVQKNGVWLHNHYGPAEAHVVTTLTIDPEGEIPELPSIGKPVANTGIYILGNEMHLQPVGVPGELYIAGIQVGRGYLRRESLTVERFMGNPFVQGERLYRTGDLARWLGDGNIEFLGRTDHQVKIRGFRVEPGEIESHLMQIQGIKEAVVIARQTHESPGSFPGTASPGGEKYLCAYVVSDETMDITQLRNHLSQSLPDYMIPAYFIRLEQIPLTPNKKVDRIKLPGPNIEAPGDDYVAPRDKTEKQLAGIWADILKLGKQTVIGIDENFFELGGHSLKATVMMTRIQSRLKVKITLGDIFRYPTIRYLAEYIKDKRSDQETRIEPIEKKEYYELSSAQKRLFILNEVMNVGIAYNISFAWIMIGKFNKESFEETIRALVRRHEILRTSFKLIKGKPVQIVKDRDSVNFYIDDIKVEEKDGLDDNQCKEIIKNFIRPFDLSTAPLLRAGLVRVTEDKYLLIFDMHHIITDGVSLGIFVKDFLLCRKEGVATPLQVQYKDFSEWQNSINGTEVKKIQEKYWLGQFNGGVPVLNISTDYSRPSVQSFEGELMRFQLNNTLTGELQQVARQTGATLSMVLLTAYSILLSIYSGQEDIVVGLGISGRDQPDMENIIGFFVNVLPIRIQPKRNKSYGKFLEEVKQITLKGYENQAYPFEELVHKLRIPGDLSRNPLFNVAFVFQNMEIGHIEIEGLEIKPYEFKARISRFDFQLSATEGKDSIIMDLEYSTALFKRSWAERFTKQYIDILDQVLHNREIKLVEITIPQGLAIAESTVLQEKSTAFDF